MPNLYTDRDYFDAKFQNIDDKFLRIDARLDRHDRSHADTRADWYKLAGIVLAFAGVVTTILTRF